MSSRPPNLNDDLLQLQIEGYEVAIRNGQVVLTSIPYVTATREVKLGTLMTPLNISAGIIGPPTTHQAWFSGDAPCSATGQRIEAIYAGGGRQDYGDGLTSDHAFSCKGPEGMPTSYYRLFHNYLGHICPPATALKHGVSPRTNRPIASADDEDVLCYRDTNTDRGRFGGATQRFRGQRVAVIGCGGTGSYVVDFLAKTPVSEIHLFDDDVFLQHNAFRAPGAPSLDTLRQKKRKVDYLAGIYSAMHRGIRVYGGIGSEPLSRLDSLTFVFIAIDAPEAKRPIIDYLERAGIAFIDVGMGVQETDTRLFGQVRTTLSTPADRATLRAHVTLQDDGAGLYNTNIQIAELNALNAAMAVIAWKKHIGFYHDHAQVMHSTYSINDHLLTKAPVHAED